MQHLLPSSSVCLSTVALICLNAPTCSPLCPLHLLTPLTLPPPPPPPFPLQYLREQRLPPMTFIPLASARVKPIDQRLRALGGTSKLVLDVIQFEEAVQVAMAYALGGTLVCDSMDEARALAWGHDRHKGELLGSSPCEL